jgi:hypothetical protein
MSLASLSTQFMAAKLSIVSTFFILVPFSIAQLFAEREDPSAKEAKPLPFNSRKKEPGRYGGVVKFFSVSLILLVLVFCAIKLVLLLIKE